MGFNSGFKGLRNEAYGTDDIIRPKMHMNLSQIHFLFKLCTIFQYFRVTIKKWV